MNDLRPIKFTDFVGQANIKRQLEVVLKSSRITKRVLPHILLYGPAGLGKTTLANIIANNVNGRLIATNGGSIERMSDLITIVSTLRDNDVLFIDEIHRLKSNIEEVLYSALEDNFISVIVGKEETLKNIKIELPRFTIIGATTKLSKLSAPLRNRFTLQFYFKVYDHSNIKQILKNNSKILNICMSENHYDKLAIVSRGIPRIANNILRRVFDYVNVYNIDKLNDTELQEIFKLNEIDKFGITSSEREYLKIVYVQFNKGPIGVRSIAALLNEDISTIEEIIEPYLLRINMITRSSKGRAVTDKAIEYIKQYL